MGVCTQAIHLKIGFAGQKSDFAQNGENLTFDPQSQFWGVSLGYQLETFKTPPP